MLLRNVNSHVFSNLDVVGNFVIVNINNFSYFEFFAMRHTVSHYNNFSGFDVLFNLFSGNNYFIFLDERSYYYDLLDLFSSSDGNFEILAVCWHNHFVNYSNRIFDISNNIFLMFSSYMSYIFFFFLLLFSKLMAIYIKINISESKDWCQT